MLCACFTFAFSLLIVFSFILQAIAASGINFPKSEVPELDEIIIWNKNHAKKHCPKVGIVVLLQANSIWEQTL